MTSNDSKSTRSSEGIVASGFALATLVLADKVTALHFLFGIPLFIYLIRDFKKVSSFSDRLIMSMAIAFVGLLFTCYPIQLILDKLNDPPDWDVILTIQWIAVFLFVWAIRELFHYLTSRSTT